MCEKQTKTFNILTSFSATVVAKLIDGHQYNMLYAEKNRRIKVKLLSSPPLKVAIVGLQTDRYIVMLVT